MKLLVLAAILVLTVAPGEAQTAPAVQVDKSYHLNIAHQVITRRQYATSLAVELGPPLPVRVGASVSTGPITLTLLDVRGDIRFHGDLRRIQQLIQSHRSLASSPAGR